MRLRKIQDSFKNTMLDPAHLDDDKGAFRTVFKTDHGISLENRMKVYRNNVIRSLVDAGMAALPMTKKLVGEDFLEQAMRHYVVDNLPKEGNLNLYGESFPAFIKHYEPAAAIPYLYDITRLEWAWEKAYYAADDTALNPAKLVEIAEEKLPDLRFSFRASFALITSEHPLDEIVDFCRADESTELQELSARGAKLMIYRPELTVEIRKLTDTEYSFLQNLYNGKTIHETAETILADDPNIDISALLQKFLGLKIFKEFKV